MTRPAAFSRRALLGAGACAAVRIGRPAAPALPDALRAFATEFLEREQGRGLSLAVAREGAIVFAEGFGHADRARRQPVTPASLFRVASLSKILTLMTACRLVETGRLAWEDPVLPRLRKTHPVLHPADDRWERITAGQLAGHRGGFDRALSGDPMFQSREAAAHAGQPPPASLAMILGHRMDLPLDFDPGAREAYSNFGYALLGLVLEQAAGDPIAVLTRKEILDPLGLRSFRPGRTRVAAEGEVEYDEDPPPRRASVFAEDGGREVDAPYGAWALEPMLAHGGWISNAADWCRLGGGLRHPERHPVLAGPEIRRRFKPRHLFFGGLDGTSTVFHHHPDGWDWCALFNRRRAASGGESLAALFNHRLAALLESR